MNEIQLTTKSILVRKKSTHNNLIRFLEGTFTEAKEKEKEDECKEEKGAQKYFARSVTFQEEIKITESPTPFSRHQSLNGGDTDRQQHSGYTEPLNSSSRMIPKSPRRSRRHSIKLFNKVLLFLKKILISMKACWLL
jgi:hypothetical protein